MECKSQIENARKEGMGGSACREEDGLKLQIENAEDEQMARGGWRVERELKSQIENRGGRIAEVRVEEGWWIEITD